ncbi:MAG: hypothetical protein Q7S99_06250 [Parvibaculum sp.]|nr:hypothetical protein [Parvibaculum sp.]
MATITNLSGNNGPLTSIKVPLGKRVLPERAIYGLEGFVNWMINEVPEYVQGRKDAADTPQEQLDAILFKWISGGEMKYDRMFKDLMPASDEVWELKTVDLRIFGWMYQPRVFIAVVGGYTDDYKFPNPKKSYETARNMVVAARNSLNLDEPKYVSGVFDALV